MKTTPSIGAPLLATLFVLAIAAAATEAAAAPDLDAKSPGFIAPSMAVGIVYPPRLNKTAMSVFSMPADGHGRYYVKPYFLADWPRFGSATSAACLGKEPSHLTSATVYFETASFETNEQIAKELSETMPGETVKANSILTYPFVVMFLLSGSDKPDDAVPARIQYRYPPSVTLNWPDGTMTVETTPPTGFGVNGIPIEGSCAELATIAEKMDLQLYLYTQVANVRVNRMSAETATFLKSHEIVDVLSREKASGAVRLTSSTSNTNVGFNFRGILGGASGSADAATVLSDDRSRSVSANVIANAARDYRSKIAVQSWTELQSEGMSEAAFIQKLLDYTIGLAKESEVAIERRADGQLEIGEGIRKRSLGPEDEDLIMQSDPAKQDLSLEGETKATCSNGTATVECSAKDAMTAKYEGSGLKFERKKGQWVPTTLTLYALNQADVSRVASLSIEQAFANDTSGFQRHLLPHVSDAKFDSVVGAELAKLREELERKREPPRNAIEIRGGLYKTISYWAGGARSHLSVCIQDPTGTDGMVKIGAADTEKYTLGKWTNLRKVAGCRPPGHCDGAGEYCESFARGPGCFVSAAWYDWYKRERDSQGPDVARACAK